ncbi:reverse transcriptase domain-containing protein [Tanacetum coccineum]|uniref:Reverse transcriptase domain-containing protein n=1 Tax=Tanacetum coccineum TaxID=301880 RepID=A0ABQ5DGQ1_9ASTR
MTINCAIVRKSYSCSIVLSSDYCCDLVRIALRRILVLHADREHTKAKKLQDIQLKDYDYHPLDIQLSMAIKVANVSLNRRSKGRTVADSIAARLTRPTAYKFKTDCSIIPVWVCMNDHGTYKIPIDPQDQEKTTFTCPYGTFDYRRMPFGLCNALGTFQRCMMAIFHNMIEKTMEVFMDDFSVFEDSFSSCLSHLDTMLKWYEDTNLVLNWEKYHFMFKEGIVLGHKISKNRLEVDRAKVDVIAKLLPPTTVKGKRFQVFRRNSTSLVFVNRTSGFKVGYRTRNLTSDIQWKRKQIEMLITQAEIILSKVFPDTSFKTLNQTSTAKEILDNVELIMQG